MFNAPAPPAVIDLLRLASASLPPTAVDRELTPFVERIARSVDADGGFLLDLPKGGTTPEVISQWVRPGVPAGQPPDLDLCPWIAARMLTGEPVVLACMDDLPIEAATDREYLIAGRVRSLLVVPVLSGERLVAIGVHTVTHSGSWQTHIPQLRFTAEILATALNSWDAHEELERARADLARLQQRWQGQSGGLKDAIDGTSDFDDIVGSSPAFVSALAAVRDVAETDTTVLLLGETGTGKELLARALHRQSRRRQRPFVCVNCSALPASLIESELFGHERGAFTGAVTTRQGRFELADHGTIFLDEIGDLPPELQPKLLRVLQEREFERVGSSARRKIDVRVVAATHRDLHAEVAQCRFRADLYYRLSVFPITLPPLRERPDDIPELVWFLIDRHQSQLRRHITLVPRATMEALRQYNWPGNVRELENVIERAMIRSADGTLRIDENLMFTRAPAAAFGGGTLEALERSHIEATLRACRGRINGPGNAAERLGLHPNTLRFRMKKLGIVRPATPSIALIRSRPI